MIDNDTHRPPSLDAERQEYIDHELDAIKNDVRDALVNQQDWKDWTRQQRQYAPTRWELPRFEHSKAFLVPDCTQPIEEIDSYRPEGFTSSFSHHDTDARKWITPWQNIASDNSTKRNEIGAFVDISQLKMLPYDLTVDVLQYVPAIKSLLDEIGV